MKNNYDVTIIGAGIGGLVCGCYLAKAGLKVAIFEKHDKPGGCCTSFTRKGYKFDVGVHYLGGLKNGILSKIFNDLDFIKYLKCNQFDPVDKILMPNKTLTIRANAYDTISEFKRVFPNEKDNIQRFFDFIINKSLLGITRELKEKTFKELLDDFFKDNELKIFLGVLLGNIGVSYVESAALAGVLLFRQYVLDPGYYPGGGIQKFPDALVKCFVDNGGMIYLSTKVASITRNVSRVDGLILESKEKISSQIVVSNIDAMQTFTKLLDFPTKELGVLNKLTPTPSFFILYVALKPEFVNLVSEKSNLWYFSDYDIDKIYSDCKKNVLNTGTVIVAFPFLHDKILQKPTATILSIAPYESLSFWKENSRAVSDNILTKMNNLIPGFTDWVDFSFCGTPITLNKYTGNANGAFAGWAPIFGQFQKVRFSQKTSVKGLYLVGHWSTIGFGGQGGIPGVAFSGERGASLILHNFKKMG